MNTLVRWWSSLTVRLILASAAWTAGLLYLAHVASVLVMFGPHALGRFSTAMLPLLVVAAMSMMTGAVVVRRALTTFTRLRERLLDVHEGRARSVTGAYMREVQPAVAVLNEVLLQQDRRVHDALARAGDLAHGLKTPLAVLTHEADRAAASGHAELAAILEQQIDRMRRHVDYHLAHARAAASGATPGTLCLVAESAQGLSRTLSRLHSGRALSIEVHVPGDHVVRVQRPDLDEMLGNLLDNACKWAASRVVIASVARDEQITVTVDDDGAGIPPELRPAVVARGVRLDESAPGSGLGLGIVRELSELYGGTLTLDASPLGGLRATLGLPRASGERSASVQVA